MRSSSHRLFAVQNVRLHPLNIEYILRGERSHFMTAKRLSSKLKSMIG